MDNLTDENANLQGRLTVAQAFINFMIRAYDALLNYSVNYRNLREYGELSAAVDEANKMPRGTALAKLVNTIGRLESGLAAAIRRKQFTRHDNKDLH